MSRLPVHTAPARRLALVGAVWLTTLTLAYGGLAAGYAAWLATTPHRVVIVVDGSFAMARHERWIRRRLDALGEAPYTRFALFSDRGQIHPWRDAIDWSPRTTYGRLDAAALRRLAAHPDFARADAVHLLTRLRRQALDLPDRWQRHLAPPVALPASR